MSKYYIIDPETHETTCLGEGMGAAEKWASSVNNHCVVDNTQSKAGRVSTVFLGLDHRFGSLEGPPILFETMIFCDNKAVDQYQTRCSTWEEAEQQHRVALAVLKAAYDGRQNQIREKFYAGAF
jgi:hypothetical protein